MPDTLTDLVPPDATPERAEAILAALELALSVPPPWEVAQCASHA